MGKGIGYCDMDGNSTTSGSNAGNPYRDMNFTQNGILSPYVHGTPICATPICITLHYRRVRSLALTCAGRT
jgi:hypothetical protein